MPRKAALLALLLTLSACGDDDAATTTSTTLASDTTAATTTTTAATTTTAVAETTTTLPPTTTTTAPLYQVDPTNFFPEVFGSPGDPHGSGCVIGDADVLPAGVWFGFVDAISGTGVMTFDLACFYTGPAGVAAATADGEVGYDLDFYIRNMNPRTFSVPISPTAQVWYVDEVTIENHAIASGDWPTSLSFLSCPGEFCAVWLYVNGGVATGIVEQYLP